MENRIMGHMSSIEAAGNLSDVTAGVVAASGAVSGRMGSVEEIVETAMSEEGGAKESDEKPAKEPAEATKVASEVTEEATKEEEKKPEPPKETEIQKANNQIRAAMRLMRKAEAEKAAIESERATIKAREAELQNVADQLRPLAELHKLGDLELLMKVAEMKGIAFKDMMRRAITHASTGEPEVTEQTNTESKELDPAMKTLMSEVSELKKMLADKDVKEAERQKKAHEEWENSLVNDFVEESVGMVNENDYPLLSGIDQAELIDEIIDVSNNYSIKTGGEVVDQKELMDYLEARYEKKAQRLSTSLQKKMGNVKTQSETNTVSSPTQGTGPDTTKSEAPKVLANTVVSERSSKPVLPSRIDRDLVKEAAAYLESLG